VAAHRLGRVLGPHDLAGAGHLSGGALLLVLRGDDHVAGLREQVEGDKRQDADGPGPGDQHGLSGLDAGAPHSVDRAGERLDQHGDLVRHVVGDRVQLRAVRHHQARPPTAGLVAVAGLQARLEVADRDAVADVGLAGLAVAAQLLAARGARQHAAEHDTGAGRQVAALFHQLADDLVAGHERRRHERREVEARLPRDRRQVAAADAGHRRFDARPAVAALGRLGVLQVDEPKRCERAGEQTGRLRADGARAEVARRTPEVFQRKGRHGAPPTPSRRPGVFHIAERRPEVWNTFA
jgi:hypothetical protein